EALSRLGRTHELRRRHVELSQLIPTALPDIDSLLRRRASQPHVDLVPFSGRQAELNILEQIWHSVRASTGHTLLIRGEAGIGKTRLAEQSVRRFAIRGARVWLVRCCAATPRMPSS